MTRSTAFAVLAAAVPLAACVTAAPPAAPGPEASASFVGRVGQASRVGRFTVTPTRVLEDSRCPATANCVWAGTVRLQLRISEAARTSDGEIGLNKPLQLGTQWLHLTLICPNKIASDPRPVTDYRFRFAFSPGAQPVSPDADCT